MELQIPELDAILNAEKEVEEESKNVNPSIPANSVNPSVAIPVQPETKQAESEPKPKKASCKKTITEQKTSKKVTTETKKANKTNSKTSLKTFFNSLKSLIAQDLKALGFQVTEQEDALLISREDLNAQLTLPILTPSVCKYLLKDEVQKIETLPLGHQFVVFGKRFIVIDTFHAKQRPIIIDLAKQKAYKFRHQKLHLVDWNAIASKDEK